MADQTEDISSIEDIGERLDELLNALESSAQEIAQTGSSLDKPLDELGAAEAASQSGAMLDDSGRVVQVPAEKPAEPEPEPEPETASEPEPEAEAEVAQDDAQDAQAEEPSAESVDAVETEADAEASLDVDDAEPEPVQEAPEPAEEAEPDLEAEASLDEAAEALLQDSAVDTPAMSEKPEPEPEPEIDDGLLIEPEARAPQQAVADIDGAPAGGSSLEAELDQELDSLLASGVFEDPLAQAGVDESATPVEIPDDVQPRADEPAESPEASGERKPNLPADEAELIGELDEQLAALADAELAEDNGPEPLPHEAATAPEPAEAASPDSSANAQDAGTSAPADAQPTPQVVTRPAAPAPAGKGQWKLHAARSIERGKPHAERAWKRTRAAVIAGATRANAPLQARPELKQVMGWVALVHVFYAVCLWAYVVLWHNPPPPPAPTAQPTLEAPASATR